MGSSGTSDDADRLWVDGDALLRGQLAHVKDLASLHDTHVADIQRQYGYGLAFSRYELDFQSGAIPVGVNDGTDITSLKTMLRQ